MKHPVVITHGFLGYNKFLLWEMFSGVADAYQKRGIEVHQPLVHPTRSIQDRAKELKSYLDEFVQNRPFHIVSHSMGGLDARYIASPNGLNMGEDIISITTIATPHHGSYLANKIPKFMRYTVSFGAWLLHYVIQDQEQKYFSKQIGENCWDALDQLRPKYLQQFNQEIIDHPSVKYFSYAATRKGKPFKISDLFRVRGYKIIYKKEGENDGMVSVKTAQWGEFKSILISDHAELVGLKIIPWTSNYFDHLQLFNQIADDLESLENELEPKELSQ